VSDGGAEHAAPGSKADSSRTTHVYTELRRGLLLGKYPLIERLAEVRLAEQFGASRTPVREALVRLDSEGLVARRPEGGFYPRSPNLGEIRDLYELRRLIEVAALTRPAELGTTHDEAALRAIEAEWLALAAALPAPDPDFVMTDERFHVNLAAAAGNGAVADHLRTINERIRVVRMHNFLHAARIEITVEQHLAILGELLAGRPEAARVLLAAHLDEAVTQAAGRVAAALERMLAVGAILDASPAAP
jgi:DNA-binding GntR family transcriptional regulator